MLAYILKLMLIQAIGLGIYYAFLRNEKSFGYARIFLWSIIIASFIVPVVYIPLFQTAEPIAAYATIPYQMQPTEIAITVSPTSTIGMTEVLWVLYFLITLTVLSRLFVAYRKLINIKKRAHFQYPNLFFTNEIEMPYSFLNGIFIPTAFRNHNKLNLIIAHENEHIKKKHSWDKIAISLLASLMWFNPLLRLYHRELEAVHEYQVDESITAYHSLDDYLESLLQTTIYLKTNRISLTHSFFSSPIKNRIIMLYKKSKNRKAKRLLSITTLITFLILVTVFQSIAQNKGEKGLISTENKKMILENRHGEQITLSKDTKSEDLEKWALSTYDYETTVDVEASYPGGRDAMIKFISNEMQHTLKGSTDGPVTVNVNFIVNVDGTINVASALCNMENNVWFEKEAIRVCEAMPKWSPATKDGHKVNSLNAMSLKFESHLRTKSDTAFTAVEQQAVYPGGDAALLEFLEKNIKYPEVKDAKKISGVIYLEFVIDLDGSVTNIKSIRTPSGMESHEKIAIEVVQKMPKWKPAMNKGKVVRQNFTLPISFEAQKENTDERK